MQRELHDHDPAAGKDVLIDSQKEHPLNEGFPRILVIGVGGVGCRTVHAVHSGSSKGAVTVAIDSDLPKLEPIDADYRLLIGRSTLHGFGCGGGFPEMAKEAAVRARDTIAPLCARADLVVLCAGLGWGTGSGAAPVVARYAKEAGALVVGVVTTPPRLRMNAGQVERADHALEDLHRIADSVIVFDSGECLMGRGDMKENLACFDNLRVEMIEEMIINAIQREPWEWDDGFQRIFGQKGRGILMCAETEKEKWVETLTHECRNNASAFIDSKGGMGACVFVYSERPVILQDLADITTSLTRELHPHALILYGWHEIAGMGDRVRVLCLITGLQDGRCPEEETTDGERSGRTTPAPCELIEFIE